MVSKSLIEMCDGGRIFLVDEAGLNEFLGKEKVFGLDVVGVDSVVDGNSYFFERGAPGVLRARVLGGNMYVLDSRGVEKPENFVYKMVGAGYCQSGTDSKVVVLKDHFGFAGGWVERNGFGGYIKDLTVS